MVEEQAPTNKDLEIRIVDVEGNVEELATAVVGPKQSAFQGGGRTEELGLVAKVDELITTLNSRGLKLRLPVPVWVAIIAGAVAITVQLIVTLSEH